MIEKRPVQIKIINNAVIGDIWPVAIFPEFTVFLIRIFSIFHVKLKKWFINIKRQINAIKITNGGAINCTKRDFSKFIIERLRKHKTINIIADKGAIGMYLREKEDRGTLLNSHPEQVRKAINRTRKRSDSLLFRN